MSCANNKKSSDISQADRHLTRRQFLTKVGTTAIVAGAAGGLGLKFWDRQGNMAGQSNEDLVKLPVFTVRPPDGAAEMVICRGSDAQKMLAQAFEQLGGLDQYISAGQTVLLKPNVAFDRPASLGATTSPEVVSAMVSLAYKAGAKKVLVTDNPINFPQGCFLKTGIGPGAAKAGAEVVIPTAAMFKSAHVPGATLLDGWEVLYEPLARADVLIGIAPAKDHNLARASLSMKNWYGLLGGRRNALHQHIDQTVAELGLLARPSLVIIDGMRVLYRNGPTGGSLADVKRADTLVVSTDPLAADAWAYEHLLERDVGELGYIKLAQGYLDDQGRALIGNSDYSKLKVVTCQ